MATAIGKLPRLPTKERDLEMDGTPKEKGAPGHQGTGAHGGALHVAYQLPPDISMIFSMGYWV